MPCEYLLPRAGGGGKRSSQGQSVHVGTSISHEEEEEEEVFDQEDEEGDDEEVSDEEWGSISCDGDEPDEAELAAAASSADASSGKLWSRAQFPEGVYAEANWDLANLAAAQEWECPCKDRYNCIGKDRIRNIFDLYEHRKRFRTTTAPANGGLRDAARLDMSRHFDKGSMTFTRSFVVGPLGTEIAAQRQMGWQKGCRLRPGQAHDQI